MPLTKPNGGHGAAVLFGYQYALDHGATFVFQTDSDGQTSASEFEGFWKVRHSYNMVIGRRTKRQDGASRVFVTKVLKLVLRLCFGVWIADANTPFRLMRAAALKECMELVPKGFNLSNVALSAIFAKKGLKVKYIPITFKPRQGGKSFINFKNIFKIGLQAIKDFRSINKTINKAIDASLASAHKGGTDD